MSVPSQTVYTDSQTTSGSIYVGTCNSISADADEAVWAIYMITTDANGDIKLEWAGGDATPNKVWSDRSTYNYQ